MLDEDEHRRKCGHCAAPLWTLMRPESLSGNAQSSAVAKALQRIPTIGEATAQKLMRKFGDGFLASMLGDNIHEFINLMDANGELVFSDRQATRMERAMANMEFGFGEGGYQPTEFIKRYLPQGTFDLLIPDEAHEYKNGGSAQGQAMGVLAAKCRKALLLTGTLMGGYGDDLFYLLFRALPGRMIEDGYRPAKNGSMTSAAMAFMRDHGVLKDIYSESAGTAHKTAKGSKTSVRTVKAPGFGPRVCCGACCRSRSSSSSGTSGVTCCPVRRGVPRSSDGARAGQRLQRARSRSPARCARPWPVATRRSSVWSSTCCWPGRTRASARKTSCIHAHATRWLSSPPSSTTRRRCPRNGS